MICIGMDAHLKWCVYKVKTDKGETLEATTIPSTREALFELARKYPGAKLVIEACGVTEWIYDTLTEAGLDVFACHPRNIRRAIGKKTDTTDAAFLVDAYLLGALPPAYIPPKPIRAQRSVARHRAFLSRQRRTVKNRIHGILRRRGEKVIHPENDEEPPTVFLKKNRERLRSVNEYQMAPLLDMLTFLDKQIHASERDLDHQAENDPNAKLLMSVPGFGPYTALTLAAEIGDVTRFRNADALAAYFGLVPSERQSGEMRIRGHITRRGSALVRGMLNQAAWNHIQNCKESSITKNYRRLAKKIGAKKAVVATQRRLVKVAYWILRDQREFKLIG